MKISARREVREQNRLRRTLERNLSTQLLKLFRRLGNEVGKALEESQSVEGVLNTIQDKVSSVLLPHYRVTIQKFTQRASRRKNTAEDFIAEFIRSEGGQHIRGISSTTRNQIMKVVLAGEQEGLGNAVIAKNIREQMQGSFSRYRANTIARTETHSASSYSNHGIARVARDGGIRMVKQWVSTLDGRTRQHHVSMNGKQAEMDEDFIVPYKGFDYAMSYTGDPRGGAPNTINCRCVTIYIEQGDEVVDDIAPKPIPITEEVSTALPDITTVMTQSKKIKKSAQETFEATTNEVTRKVINKVSLPSTITIGKEGVYYAMGKTKRKPRRKVGESTDDYIKRIMELRKDNRPNLFTPLVFADDMKKGRRSDVARAKEYEKRKVNPNKFVLANEYGHHIDYRISGKGIKGGGSRESWSETNEEFQRALQDDAKKLFKVNFFSPSEVRNFKRKATMLRGDKKVELTLAEQQSLDKLNEIADDLRDLKDLSGGSYNIRGAFVKTDHSGERMDLIDGLTRGTFRESVEGVWGHGSSYFSRRGAVEKEAFANMFALYSNKKAWSWITTNLPNTARVFEKKIKEVAEGSVRYD